jgi:type II secretory pathway component GspD/PulD (secretin)
MNGIALIREGTKFLRVVPNASARTEPMQFDGLPAETQEPGDASKEPAKPRKDSGHLISQMIQLKHLTVADAQKAVEALKHPYGQIHIFENVNGMLVTDTAATVNRMLEMLEFIDKPPETREVPLIYSIRFAKASEIKAKLDEIITQTQKDQAQSTVPQLRSSGAPGVVATPTLPGVIRAVRPPATPAGGSPAEAADLAERGIISGTVKTVADDRTGKLIIISWPENKVFFDMVIQVLDVETAPDVMVKVFRLEYAKADEVETMLNGLIGAVTAPGQTKTGTPGPGAPGGGPAAESAALKEYIDRQQAATAAAKSGGTE